MLLKQPLLLRRVVFDGYDYGLVFSYFPGLAEVAKRFRGRFVGDKEHLWELLEHKREVADDLLDPDRAAALTKQALAAALEVEAA